MKILMVHDVGSLVGGAELSLLHIRREMEQRGHEIRMLTADSPSPDPGFSDYTFHSGDATRAGKFFHHLYNRSAARAVRGAIADFRPHVIHACTVTRVSPAGVRAMRPIPTVMDLRDYGLVYPNLHTVLPRAEFCGFGDEACCCRHAGYLRYYFERVRVGLHRRNFPYISAFIVNSGYLERIAEQLEMTPAINLGNPVDVPTGEDYNPVRLPGTILFAGRLEPEKGILELLDSFELVLREQPGARLLIAGEGSLRSRIESRVRSRGLATSVAILGHLDQQKLLDWYRQVQLVAVPSLWPEPFGLVGPEAMSLGVPVVASGTGGMRDWLEDGHNGLIADPRDAAAFAAALLRLLKDEALYEELSLNARLSTRRFQTSKYMDRLEQVYLDAVAASSSARSRAMSKA